MINDYNNERLRMIGIKFFIKSLKSSWISKYIDTENHGKWKLLFALELQLFGGEEIFEASLQRRLQKIGYLYFRNITNLDGH